MGDNDLLISLDSITFVGKTLPQVLSFFGKNTQPQTQPPTYQQVFQFGNKLHAHLRKKGPDFCSCKFLLPTKARTACLVLWNFQPITRKSFCVVPTDSLYADVDDVPSTKSKKRKKTSAEKLEADDVLCILYVRQVPGGSVRVTHCPMVYRPSFISSTNWFRSDYNTKAAQEIWSKSCETLAEEFVALNVADAWNSAFVEEALLRGDVVDTDTTTTSRVGDGNEGSSTDTESMQVVRDEKQQADILVAMGLSPDCKKGHEMLRDRAILTSWNLSEFCKEGDSSIFTIAEDRSRDMPFSLMFFTTLRKAASYARANRLPLFAQDIVKGSRAKNYFVPDSWDSAYMWIRFGKCMRKCPQMLEQTRGVEDGKRAKYNPNYENGNTHVHEIVGVPERPLQFFVDMDTDFTEAPHLAIRDASADLGIVCNREALDDLTEAIQCWFTWFIRKVFGDDKADLIDPARHWMILCATDVNKCKVSRHIRLDGPLHFKSIIDLMMFMDLAKVQMYEDLGRGVNDLRTKIKVYPERKELTYLNRMLIYKTEVDPMTKMNVNTASFPIDFQVYRINGSMRGPMCSKIDEPFRFTRFAQHPEIRWIESPSLAEDIREEATLFKRAFITHIPYVSVPLSLPIGEMFTLSPIDVDGSSLQGPVESINKTERILMSIPRSVWISSSSIGDKDHKEELMYLFDLIDKHNMMRDVRSHRDRSGKRKGSTLSGNSGRVDRVQKFKRCLGDWISSTSTILSSSPKVRAIRDYFTMNNNEDSRHYLLPWADSPSIKTELHIDESYEEKIFRNHEGSACGRKESRRSTDPLSRHYREGAMDFYRVTVYKTSYCPIKGAGHEGQDGKGGEAKSWLRIYRNGTVHCRCFTSGCADIIGTLPPTKTGKPRYFYPLPILSERLRKVLWMNT